MYRRRQYARRPRKYARKGMKGKKLTKPLRAAMTRVAKRVVARAAENKQIGWFPERDVDHNSAIGAADCEPIVTEIVKGTSSLQRVGDRVSPKSLKVKGMLSLQIADYPNSLGDIYARVIIAAQKDVKTGSEILNGGIDANSLLRPSEAGTGNDQIGFAGDTGDVLLPINTDKFRVYCDKLVKFHLTPNDSTNPNSAFSRMWSYTFTKKMLPQSLTFDEGNGDWPNNFAPFIAIGYAYSDGSSPDTLQTKLRSNVFCQLKYEDL